MRVRHPVDAQTFADLDAEYLIDYALASTLGAYDTPGRSRELGAKLASVREPATLADELRTSIALVRTLWAQSLGAEIILLDEADAALAVPDDAASLKAALPRWMSVSKRALAAGLDDQPVDMGRPIFAALPLAAAALLDALALAHVWSSDAPTPLLLPAAPEPRIALPPLLAGEKLVIEVGDLRDPISAAMHTQMRAALEGKDVCWRWMHGPTTRHPDAVEVSRLAETVAQRSPAVFGDAIERLFRSAFVPPAEWADLLYDLPIDASQLGAVDEAHEGVRRDHRMLRACAVPEDRPAFIVGRRFFWGADCVQAVFAELGIE